MESLRIGMVLSNPIPPEEGIGNYVYNLSKELVSRGHTVTIFTRGGLSREEEIIDGINVIKPNYLPCYPLHIQAHRIYLTREVKKIEKDLDILHVHTPLTSIKKTKLPIVSTIHTSIIEDIKHIEVKDVNSVLMKSMAYSVTYPLVADLIRRSSQVTTVSDAVRQEIMRYYENVDPVVVGNGVDIGRFVPKSHPKQSYILSVGRISYRKGVLSLPEIALNFIEKPDLKFIIVGKGELELKLKNIIKNKSLEDKIIMKRDVSKEEIVQLYQNALLFILPSYYEGLPTVLLEAMAAGLPVIARDIPSVSEVITNEKNGLLVNGSIEEFTKAIERVIADRTLGEMIGVEARNTVVNHYSWREIANKFEILYKKV